MHDIFAYHTMDEAMTSVSNDVRQKASELLDAMSSIENCRELSLAHTKLEEAIMWANKVIITGGVRK